MVGERGYKEPKRLEEMAMMKLIHMLIERFLRTLRSNPNINRAGDSDAIREETLVFRHWIYEPLSCSVANNVQELILKSIYSLVDEFEWEGYPCLRYCFLLLLDPKCCNLRSKWFFNDMVNVTDMLQSFIHLEHIEWSLVHRELTSSHIDRFTTNLKYFTRLRVFVCNGGCNDEIVKVLSQNCPLLSVLKIADTVTDESTHYIKNMKSLTKCYIYGTSITIEGVVSILKNCTQLCKLDMKHDICDILKSLEDADYSIELLLRTVQLYNPRHITSQHIDLLKKYCPFLAHVDIEFGCQSTVPLCQLGSVEQLTIQGSDYEENISHAVWYSTLNTWLMVNSINVITLNMIRISNEDFVELSNAFPNITELYAWVYCSFYSNGYVFSECRPFQKLKKLKFKNLNYEKGQYRKRDTTLFKILLSYSTMLTHVDIIGLNITDGTVATVFKTNKMRYLEYCRIEKAACTSKTFYLLFRKCPMLKFIGKLSTWEIHPDEVQEIENDIRDGNYDLDIAESNASLCSITKRARDLFK